jgi:hypothetical protein
LTHLRFVLSSTLQFPGVVELTLEGYSNRTVLVTMTGHTTYFDLPVLLEVTIASNASAGIFSVSVDNFNYADAV